VPRERLTGRLPSGIGRRLAAGAIVLLSGVCTVTNASSLVVETSAGALRGMAAAEDGVRAFRGIPFAQPPTGERRWREPATAVAWQGIRDATRFGPPCWQTGGAPDTLYYKDVANVSEDCLYLNVWTAAAAAGERRPVMVWFHGGGNQNGTGSTPNFDGTSLARRGVVVVTINYRLGPFGFLAHPGLTAESAHGASGNYGLLDQVAALQWVRDHIAAFGGDAGRVTIFGQSAGSWDVGALMVSPLARGLFHRAIGQSGQFLHGVRSLDGAPAGAESAHATGLRAAAALGVEGTDAGAVARLRALDARQVFDAMQRVVPGYPIVDGHVIPRQPLDAYARGEFARVPLIAGTMAHETNLLAVGDQDAASVTAAVRERFGAAAARVLDAYADVIARSPTEALAEILSDSRQTRGAREWVRLVADAGGDAWHYYFAHRPPVYRIYRDRDLAMPSPKGPRAMGAYHSGELVYVFDNVRRTPIAWDPHDHTVADAVSGLWVRFATAGDPNGPGLPRWPKFTAGARETLEIGERIAAHADFRAGKLAAFDGEPAPGP
jgi:para-nitrobenzyl esterase